MPDNPDPTGPAEDTAPLAATTDPAAAPATADEAEDEAELPEDAATLDADLPGTPDTAEVVDGPSVAGLGGIVIAGADGS